MKYLVLAVLALSLAGAAAADAPTADVLIPGKLFAPSDLSILVDTTVTWRNGDSSTHTVTADNDSFDSGDIPPGGTFTRNFDRPGTYRLHCTIHRFMRGIVRVYAVVLTGPDHPLHVGARTTLSGLAPADAPVVVLQRRGARGWEEVTRRPPLPGGGFSFVLRAAAPAFYRTLAGGTGSPVVAVHVAPAVAARIDRGRVAVTTAPPRPGSRAVLQVYDREHFTFFGVARALLDTSGRAQFPVPAALPTHLRVVVRGSGGWSDGLSRVLAVRP